MVGKDADDVILRRTRTLAAAAAHEREGRLGEAERLYGALLAADGEDFDALLRLGTVKIAKGEPEDGELLIRRCVARGPMSPAAHVKLAAALLALQCYEDAIAQCRLALAVRPDLVDAHINLGSAFQALNHPDEAIENYQRALAVDPNLVVAYFNLATAFQVLKRHDEAIASYERVLAANPEVAEAQYGLGVSLSAQGLTAAAIARFERALAIDPDFAEAAFELAQGLQVQKRHAEAILRYEQALDVDPEYFAARAGLGTAFQALDRSAEATTCFEAVRAASVSNPKASSAAAAYRAHGRECVAERHFEEAFDSFEKAVVLAPDDAATHAEYGLALASADRIEDAFARYRQALTLDPDHTHALCNLGAALTQTGRIEEAQRMYEQVLARTPGEATPYYALAELRRITLGDPMLAVMERLVSAPEMQGGPGATKLHFALGKAYRDIGDHERSLRHFIAGNALKRRTMTYDEAGTLRAMAQTARVFTPQLLRDKAGGGFPSEIPVFVLGYPRSGSTLVEQVLASHPSIYGAGERLDFSASVIRHCPGFPGAVPSLSSDALWELGAEYVTSLARSAPNAARIIDKMPGNYIHVGLVRLALPKARVIHTYRDPIDTCLSCFSHLFESRAMVSTYDLGELGRHYRAYATLMEHWRRVLPAGSMLEIRYEDVVANLEREARRILAYCGLPWDDACLDFHKTERVVRTASAVQVRQPIYQSSVGRARPESDLLKPLLDALD